MPDPYMIEKLDQLHAQTIIRSREDHDPHKQRARTAAKYQFSKLVLAHWPEISLFVRRCGAK